MIGITIAADASGNISLEMGLGGSVDQRCKPGKFYVYTHKDKDGNVFYVGKGTGSRADSRQRAPEWLEYVDKRSEGKFTVGIVRDGISEEDALEIEDAVMKIHGATIINLVNQHAPYDPTKFRAYCEAQRCCDESLLRATDFKKAKEYDKAIPEFEAAYAHHLEMVRNGNYDLGARGRLSSTATIYRRPTSALVNGYSMVLEKAGRYRELVAFGERYFQDYEGHYFNAEVNLKRRMEKARTKQ